MAITLNKELCKGCGCCTDACFEGAMELGSDRVIIVEDYCIECGECMAMCPSAALSLDGQDKAGSPPPDASDSISL